jgi:hypothetical protein
MTPAQWSRRHRCRPYEARQKLQGRQPWRDARGRPVVVERHDRTKKGGLP